jgi:long-chain acyl-CoA synthetase
MTIKFMMTNLRPWEATYPKALRTYVPDLLSMPDHPAELAAEAAKAFGARTAFSIVLPSGRSADLGFDRVDSLSDAFAAFLREDLGLSPGEVVAVQLPNSLHYPLAVFGAWKAGLIVTTVNPLCTPPEAERQLADSGAKVLIACDLFLASFQSAALTADVHLVVASLWDFFPLAARSAIRAEMEAQHCAGLTPTVKHHRFRDAIAPRAGTPKDRGARCDIVLYQYTGGTTGRSKAAMITGKNVLSTLRMFSDFLDGYGGRIEGGTTLTVLPLCHIFAFTGFLLHLRAGSHNVVIPSPRPLKNLRSAFEAFRINWMAGVDTLFAGLLAEPWFREWPPRLRFVFAGGTAIRPTTAQAWEEAISPIVEGYGLAESTSIVACNPPTAARRIGTVGLPLPGCKVKVVDEAGADLEIGRAGELLVRGPQIIGAYRGQPEENARAFVDGWFRTGDVAQIEADGYIRIIDRKKDMILVSGFNVYPNEVEAVIAKHPGVVDVAVIGVPDERTGEAVRAFVVSRQPDLTARAIIKHCRSSLAAYKMPKEVVFRDQLPKSQVGKTLRAQLRDLG